MPTTPLPSSPSPSIPWFSVTNFAKFILGIIINLKLLPLAQFHSFPFASELNGRLWQAFHQTQCALVCIGISTNN
jgi:hypothetical protein